MAWIAIDKEQNKDGWYVPQREYIFPYKPYIRTYQNYFNDGSSLEWIDVTDGTTSCYYDEDGNKRNLKMYRLPKGTIKKMIGRELSFGEFIEVNKSLWKYKIYNKLYFIFYKIKKWVLMKIRVK